MTLRFLKDRGRGTERLELLEWGADSSRDGEVLDEEVDFGKYRTFAIVNPANRSEKLSLNNKHSDELIENAITKGIDTFDSCYPTRLARHGTLLTTEEGSGGRINIKSGKHSKSYGIPIDSNCSCPVCQRYDRPYLWHLFKAREPLFTNLATLHNIAYMNTLMAKYRQDILDDKI